MPCLSPSAVSVSGLVKTLSAETSQSQIMSPAPVSASARRSTSDTMLLVMPPAKACCITVNPISMTISTRPPSSAGPTMSLVRKPSTVSGRADDPDDQEEPGRDQHHRAVVVVRREIDHEREAENGDEEQRYARDAGGDRRREQRDRDQRAEKGEPADGDVGVAHMPAVEIEIGEQKHQQRCREDRFARRPPDAFGARRHVEDLWPESEIDADIDQHRPAERGRGREHDAAFDHEQDGQEQRQQAGNADDDALIERERIELVLVGVGLPQIELRQIVGAQFGDEGDHGAGIERDAVNVGVAAVLALRADRPMTA